MEKIKIVSSIINKVGRALCSLTSPKDPDKNTNDLNTNQTNSNEETSTQEQYYNDNSHDNNVVVKGNDLELVTVFGIIAITLSFIKNNKN